MEFIPFLIVFHITGNCNLNCDYCYANKYSTFGNLPLEKIKEILCQAKDLGARNIIFSGGEPLLHPNIFEILEYSHGLSLVNHITTNGTLINKNNAKLLKKYDVDLTISLDGSNKEINDAIRGKTFDKAINSIKYLKENNVYTSLRMTLMKNNINDVKSYLDLALELGVDRCIVERMTLTNKSEKSLEPSFKDVLKAFKIMNQYSNIKNFRVGSNDPLWLVYNNVLDKFLEKDYLCGGCTAGVSALCINQDLTVSPCPRLQVNSGDLKNTSLRDIWVNSKVFKDLRNRELFENCSLCIYKNLCGGCRGASYSHGSYLGEDPHCWMFKDEVCNDSYPTM